MTDSTQTAQATPATTPPSTELAVASKAPDGYIKTHIVQFIDGILHQKHEAPYAGPEPREVFVPVAGQEQSPQVDVQASIQASAQTTFGALKSHFEKAFDDMWTRIKTLESQVQAHGQVLSQTAASPKPVPASPSEAAATAPQGGPQGNQTTG